MPFVFLFGIDDLTLCSSDLFCFVLFCFILFCFVTDLGSACKTTVGREKVRFDGSKG